ncbi:hypothetical protein A3860_02710 [Niastella vici]|uniref:Hemerythrin-like domain-containing protein n=1 Tax=Niastella vici TaxID=1703345 RepID=A0A1V9G9J0_9BACT|nr:hemerythrin domain-containing protein [Niastella vici]OQP67283.1 hypothetical protein A3860_02710 [Niastella vici]
MRYNIFNQIHKALRALLYDTALIIQQTDFTNAAETAKALEKIKVLVELFDKHAYYEDNYILPAIEEFDAAVIKDFEQEHQEDYALGQQLRQLMDGLTKAIALNDRIEAGLALHNAFVAFMVFNLTHMAKEEQLLNAVLWKHFDDGQIMALNRTIVANISQEEMELGNFWMLKSLNNLEIINWLKLVRVNATEPAFRGLYLMASDALPDNRWQTIKEALGEGAVA